VNKAPTCFTGEPYWGAVKKAYDIDQYGAPPMDGSKEDDQAGAPVPAPVAGLTCCNGKPYWGAVKKACGVDQYRAPPMVGSKDGQAGEPVGALATAVVARGQRRPQ
jgi:hypothetical protein